LALAVVLLSEFTFIVPPRGLFLLSKTIKSVDILRVLLSSSALVAHITDLDEHNNTVLMLASMNGHTETVRALLACPAVIESAGVVNTEGDTALMLAHGYTEIVMALLTCPAVVESAGVVNCDGYTALMLASKHGHTEAAEALLACPAVIESAGIANAEGDTALMLASMVGHAALVRESMQRATTLMIAEQTGLRLYQKKANPTMTKTKGWGTPKLPRIPKIIYSNSFTILHEFVSIPVLLF
jgi:ankyrin repeat protein